MLKIENLKKTYGSFTLDVSLHVAPGRITGLIGQNGAGKSTTFKALLGLIRPEGGSITVLGKDIRVLTPRDRDRIGAVLSDSTFSGYLTARDIIPILRHLYADFREDAFRAQLQKHALPMKAKLKDFSTGMKAKLKVLIALSHGARLLVLDEPTAGLDVIARDELLLLLREFMEEGDERAILLSSHISSDIESLCDDLYMIRDGKIVLHEDTDVLLSEYAVLKVTPEQYAATDRAYLLYAAKEPFGYSCLTREKQFYRENYPTLTVENSTVDRALSILIRGEKL